MRLMCPEARFLVLRVRALVRPAPGDQGAVKAAKLPEAAWERLWRVFWTPLGVWLPFRRLDALWRVL